MKKIIIVAIFIILAFLTLSGCSVKSAKQLINQAKNTHGECEVVSQYENDENTKVVLRDRLQGFEYEMRSYMDEINIDGSSFGSVPNTDDTFDISLRAYVLDDSKNQLDEICNKYNASYEAGAGDLLIDIRLSATSTDSDIVTITEEVASLMQKYNLKNRIDGLVVDVSYNDEWLKQLRQELREDGDSNSYVFSSAGGAEVCHIGSAILPDCKFRNKDKEQEDYYLEMAQIKNQNAKYVGSETKSFADVGIPLYRVQNPTLSLEKGIKEMSDPVIFYYFNANGKEFYICNFLDIETGTWYTNYDEIYPNPQRRK